MPKANSDFEKLRAETESQKQTIASLLQRIEELQTQLKESLDGNKELRNQLSKLQDQIDELLIQIRRHNDKEFGSSTERHNPRQAPSSNPEDSDDEPKKQKEKKPRNHKKNICANLANLPTKPVPHPVKPELHFCPKCNVETKFVRNELTHQLERLLQSLVVLEHQTEIRSCPSCKEYIVSGEKPEAPLPGALPGPCLLTDVIVCKFADALPNYRQQSIFEREDAVIPRQTQCDWIIAASLTLEPLYDLMLRRLLESKIVQTDDTHTKIQNRKRKGKMRRGKMTAYRGDKNHPYVIFDFSPDESFDRNKKILANYRGHVQADAATGFDALFQEDSGKTEVGCNAHNRRNYHKCRLTYVVICDEILSIYHELYKIERTIRDKDASTRLSERQAKSKPLTESLKKKLLDLQNGNLNPTNPLLKAVNYTLNHWDALVRFLEDPDFDIDNNACERAIKSWVLIRKNALFVGSDRGGKAAAIHLSFMASCKRNDVNPYDYLVDVFTKINSTKINQLDQFLPDKWAEARAKSKAPANKAPP